MTTTHYLGHLHLHNGVHDKKALAHLHTRQFWRQVHFIRSLQPSETCGIVIQTGIQDFSFFIQPKFAGEGISGFGMSLIHHIPAW